ncbi:MAG: protein usg, partial [Rhizobiales bacterium]|nr:protein usg [Hyphomicrobiales bacterium]
FPRLIKFLDFWSHNLDGPLSTIRVAHAGISGPAEMRFVDKEWRLH